MAGSKAGAWSITKKRLAGTKTFAVTARGKTAVFARGTKATAKATATMATVVTGTALHTLAVIETAGAAEVALTVTTETAAVVAAKAATASTGTGATGTASEHASSSGRRVPLER